MRGNGRFEGEIYADKGTFSGELANDTIENITQFWWSLHPSIGISFWNKNPKTDSAILAIDNNGIRAKDFSTNNLNCDSVSTGTDTVFQFNYSEQEPEAVVKTVALQTNGTHLIVSLSLDKPAT